MIWDPNLEAVGEDARGWRALPSPRSWGRWTPGEGTWLHVPTGATPALWAARHRRGDQHAVKTAVVRLYKSEVCFPAKQGTANGHC